MTVNLPIDEFRSELNHLIERRVIKLDIEMFIELLAGGPVIPFVGYLFGREFKLRRNVQWLWRSSKYVSGSYVAKGNETEVTYHLETDVVSFVLIRVLFLLPIIIIVFATLFSSVGSIFGGLVLLTAAYVIIHFIDLRRAKKLELVFQSEMNMLPHNYKSRFRK